MIKEVYIYGTDFIINLANILNLSYYEINTLIFCFLYPLIIIGLILIFIIQKKRWNRLIGELENI